MELKLTLKTNNTGTINVRDTPKADDTGEVTRLESISISYSCEIMVVSGKTIWLMRLRIPAAKGPVPQPNRQHQPQENTISAHDLASK